MSTSYVPALPGTMHDVEQGIGLLLPVIWTNEPVIPPLETLDVIAIESASISGHGSETQLTASPQAIADRARAANGRRVSLILR
jgi:hypothetical protein